MKLFLRKPSRRQVGRGRRPLLAGLLAVLAVPVLSVGLTSLPAHADQIGLYPSMSPAEIKQVFQSIGADGGGGTVAVTPGTYNLGIMTIGDVAPLNPNITVIATDGSNLPVFVGSLTVQNANGWNFSNLRFAGSQQFDGTNSLFILGGSNWTVQSSEIFGANATGGFANLAIGNSASGPPVGWKVINNCIHDGGLGNGGGTHGPLTDHNIYVVSTGNAPGYISRNILYGATRGAGIKIGGGNEDDAGSEVNGVVAHYNTISSSRRGIVLIGKSRQNDIQRNLVNGRGQDTEDVNQTRDGFYLAASKVGLNGLGPNTVANNYFRSVPKFPSTSSNPIRSGSYVAGTTNLSANIIGSASPGFNATACGAFVPSNSQAAAYGRYGGDGSSLY